LEASRAGRHRGKGWAAAGPQSTAHNDDSTSDQRYSTYIRLQSDRDTTYFTTGLLQFDLNKKYMGQRDCACALRQSNVMAFDKNSNGRRIDVASKLSVYHRVTFSFSPISVAYRPFQQFSFFFTDEWYI